MKLIMLMLLISVCVHAQPDIKTGTWTIGQTTITRPVDSVQIETTPCLAPCPLKGVSCDTFKVVWISPRQYKTTKPGHPTLYVRVYRSGKWGYSGKLSDGKHEKWFEAKRQL